MTVDLLFVVVVALLLLTHAVVPVDDQMLPVRQPFAAVVVVACRLLELVGQTELLHVAVTPRR